MASSLSSFEQFCGNSPFWNQTLLLEGSYPQFTECFRHVALIWIPCLLFLLASPLYLVYVLGRRRRVALPLSCLNLLKMTFSLGLLIVSVVLLIVKATDSLQSEVPDVLYVSEGLKVACFFWSMVLIQIERSRGATISMLHWPFFFFMLIFSIVNFYTYIVEKVQNSDLLQFVCFYVYFGLLFLQLVTFSFAEKSKKGYQDLSQTTNPSPEITASIPSKLTFMWIAGLLVRGFKKTIAEEDVYDLPPADVSDASVPYFEEIYKKEKERVDAYNEKIRPTVASSFYKSLAPGHLSSNEKTPLIRGTEKNSKQIAGLKEQDSPGPHGAKPAKSEPVKKPKSPFKEPSLFKVLFKTAGPLLLTAQFMKTLMDLLTFATPKITEALLGYVAARDTEQAWKGYVLAGSYFVVQLIVSLGSNQGLLLSKRMGMRIKAVLIAAIYKKSLTITSSDTSTTSGEIVNLMSVDSQRMVDICTNLYLMFSMPFQLVLSLYLLYQQLNVAVFAGLAVMLLAVPANTFIGIFLKKYQIEQMKLKDQRMRVMTEVLAGMKVLKLYAWEGSFQEKIEAIRKKELNVIKKFSYIIGVLIFLFNTMPYLVQLTAFGVYIAISEDGYLNPQVAFVSLQLFNLLNIPLTSLPLFIPMVIQAGVSITRISNYLSREDIKPDIITKDPSAANAVTISDGEFTWDEEQPLPTLRNINLEVKPGSLVAVVGSVGCGKSSLLSAIMGEMQKNKGSVTINNSLAYVPQEAWIQNATLRDNILFGSEFHRKKYDKVIEACALKADLEILQGGDRTEIGEKGINISGGQKQRVSLARAVYSNNSIYLLDDPLSAVDSHVGKHIFQEVIGPEGLLKHKTRILVTHGIHWLPLVETVVVMNNGRISEVGTYDELVSRDGPFAQFLREHIQEDLASETDHEGDPEVEEIKRAILQRLESVTGPVLDGGSSADERRTSIVRSRKTSMTTSARRGSSITASARMGSSITASARVGQQSSLLEAKRTQRQHSDFLESANYLNEIETSLQLSRNTTSSAAVGERLTESELGAEGKVKLDIYLFYIRAVGMVFFGIALLFHLLSGSANIFSGIWLSMWTDDSFLANTSRSGEEEYQDKTTLYLVIYGVCGVAQGAFILVYAMITAAKMADASGKLHAAMLFNILRSPMSFFDTTPGGRIVNRFSRDIEVIDNTLPATLKQTFGGIIRVLSTIITICYGVPIFLSVMVPIAILYVLIQMVYIATSRQLRRIDSTTRSPIYVHFSETLSGAASIRAYGVQERFIAESKRKVDHNFKFYFAGIATNTWLSFLLQFLGNLIVLAAAIFAVSSRSIGTGVVGLAVSYATQMTGALEWLVNMMSEVEINIVSVERVKEYTETQQEAAWILPHHRPNKAWPEHGYVTFDAYQTRYRPGLDLVLKDVTCNIKGGEKIGIVGRTGAGKSSMTVALFRIIEAAGGKIVIDGEDVSAMGLHDLRSKLTILPQEPVIFSGTLRMNLDPFDRHNDAEIWDALEHAYLRDFVAGLSQGLDYQCGEGGSNLSVGQRQLVCLARTLLRKTKILVLDEATAAVDFETDELIQKTIRTEFKDSTVLTIAHRLNTILDYDRIMVLDKGKIKEFDSPSTLLADKSSIFHGMAKDAGLV
ncbi:hypothetical protein BsWGS_22617 [Bradybaena similaris]